LVLSSAIADGSNVYLALVRETPIASGNSVAWKPSTDVSGLGWDPDRQINGNPGDFTGIAVGDWVRKSSEGASKYYQVVGINESGAAETTDGAVATATATDLLLDRDISASSSEPLRFFQQRYDASSLVVDDATSRAAGTYNDALAYFWIGARKGDKLFFREYGMMAPEERREAGGSGQMEQGKYELQPRSKVNTDYAITTTWQTDLNVVTTGLTTVRYITLPLLATSGMPDGSMFTVSDGDGTATGALQKVIVRPHATDVAAGRTISGMPAFDLDSPYMSATFRKNGTSWIVS
jgi:hypothetical protein